MRRPGVTGAARVEETGYLRTMQCQYRGCSGGVNRTIAYTVYIQNILALLT